MCGHGRVAPRVLVGADYPQLLQKLQRDFLGEELRLALVHVPSPGMLRFLLQKPPRVHTTALPWHARLLACWVAAIDSSESLGIAQIVEPGPH